MEFDQNDPAYPVQIDDQTLVDYGPPPFNTKGLTIRQECFLRVLAASAIEFGESDEQINFLTARCDKITTAAMAKMKEWGAKP